MLVTTFDLILDDPRALLVGGRFVVQLESAIEKQLPACNRLLRWAVVKINDSQCFVEGAYLQ